MALADPQSIKISGVTSSLPRVKTDGFLSEYRSEDGLLKFTVSTQENSRKRHMLRVDVSKISDDPLNDNLNEEISFSTYLVVDHPKAGWTNTEILAVLTGFFELMTATESKVLKAALQGQS